MTDENIRHRESVNQSGLPKAIFVSSNKWLIIISFEGISPHSFVCSLKPAIGWNAEVNYFFDKVYTGERSDKLPRYYVKKLEESGNVVLYNNLKEQRRERMLLRRTSEECFDSFKEWQKIGREALVAYREYERQFQQKRDKDRF